jgi:hypothetical protein
VSEANDDTADRGDDPVKTIELPAQLTDDPSLDAHNQALRAHEAELDWSVVVPSPAPNTVLEGFDPTHWNTGADDSKRSAQ